MSSPQQSVETKKKNFANYRIFGFWLANHLKDEGLIDVETCGKLIGAQKTFEAKDAQEEFYGKFFAALPDVTKDLKELAKSSTISEKQAEKAAKVAAKAAEKEAAKAAKVAAKAAEKEAAKAAKAAEKEAAKAAKAAEKEAAKAAKAAEKKAAKTVIITTTSKVPDETVPITEAPDTPLIPEEYEELMETDPIMKEIHDENDKVLSSVIDDVLSETGSESLVLEVNDTKKKKTMFIKRPIQINNICFTDAEMKTPANALCVMPDANENSEPIFQYKRGKKTK